MEPSESLIQIVDDDEALLSLYEDYFEGEGYRVEVFADPLLALDKARRTPYEAVVCDITMPGIDGITYLDRVKQENPELQVIMVTARAEISVAMEAMKLGAFDYVLKPARLEKLQVTVQNAIAKSRLLKRKASGVSADDSLQVSAVTLNEFGVVARSPSMVHLIERAKYVSEYFTAVLIRGEVGSGKEALAALIHKASHRGEELFKIACQSTSNVEHALFGDPMSGSHGLLDKANGSTLLIKGVEQLPPRCQTKLLHYLDTGEVPVDGQDAGRLADTRIVVTSSTDLKLLLESGVFREDLYYRLGRIEFQVPSLNDRRDDVLPLAMSFLNEECRVNFRQIVGFTEQAEAALKNRYWTGNVSELKDIVTEACANAGGNRVDVTDFPASMR